MKDFSVCMSVYKNDNPDDFITAVHSIYYQTVKPGEIILVVDGPVPDAINEAIHSLSKEIGVLHVIRLAQNVGHAGARQTALEAATNEIVAIMDSDDVSLPDRFEKQMAYWERHPEVAVLGGQIAEFVDSEEHVVGKRIVPLDDREIKSHLVKRCPFNQMSVTMLRSPVLAVGGYLDWYCNEDYYLWIRLYLAGCKFANLPDTLVHARVGKDMYARRGSWRYFKSEARLQKYMLGHGVIGLPRYCFNVAVRFVVQVVLPNRLRGFVFQKLFRKQ